MVIGSMKKIGITLRVENFTKYNEKRDAISHDWIKYLSDKNILPIFIPNNLPNLDLFLDTMKLDGIILSGGDNPGESLERDVTEEKLLNYGIKKSIPIIGICRGLQVINNFFGGKIEIDSSNTHVKTNHKIQIIDNKFKNFFNSNELTVNSFHNNIILENFLGKEIKIFAKSKHDNTIEGIIHEKLPIMGVMWHPEREKIEKEINLMSIFHNSLWLKT